MGEKHWLESLYDTFMMRDLVGYCLPGAVFLIGIAVELKVAIDRTSLWGVSSVYLCFSLLFFGYAISVGLRLLGTIIPLLVFHRRWGILGSIEKTPRQSRLFGSLLLYCQRVFWRNNESSFREHLMSMPWYRRDACVRREAVFMHLCGHLSVALLMLAVGVFIIPGAELAKLVGVPQHVLIYFLIASGILFLSGHPSSTVTSVSD